ncbi:GNAT family N-acetyltransferase [Fusibacter ferrireducens]|uniref:GNAT family N-acetyltransferase n=1 Tax=Fusibacter ferrireducens TaxID=2785058 RepID=A0ABR9ZSJ4_9FIRM|nr:GNAT family N-acetyltransferase [Fusibacter ferrireducens]MBF4692850.1 GNAT family N-acetyltransferase [Fusibacter ferrireducens]
MISTPRLTLLPMSSEFYEALARKDMRYFDDHFIDLPKSFIEPKFTKIVNSYISMLSLGCDDQYLGWLIKESSSGIIIGDFSLNGMPDDGEIEISYSIEKAYQNKGYGTELIKGILLWCFFQPKIKIVKAQTKPSNKKSQAMLQKNGFKIVEVHHQFISFQIEVNEIASVYPEYRLENGVAVSSCLLGLNAKYSGGHNNSDSVIALSKQIRLIPFCPEQLGGLPTPRDPAEIVDYKVITKQGEDVTLAFEKGAEETLKILELLNIRAAILKDGSPSCGSYQIYDGTFSMKKILGVGKTCEKIMSVYDTLLIYNEQRDLLIWERGV